MRSGLIGKKLGMTRVFTEDGREHAVTLLKIEKHEVISQKTIDKDGYNAVVVGTLPVAEHKLTKPMQGYFKALGVDCYKMVREFRAIDGDLLEKGFSYGADYFETGSIIDVTAVSIGKGFAGPMKRHYFGGLRATHGVSVSHRSHGSTGNREEPGRVFKGKKMAGHMGAKQVTIQNLKVFSIDGDLLVIEGSVPGPEGGYVIVKDAVKKRKQQS